MNFNEIIGKREEHLLFEIIINSFILSGNFGSAFKDFELARDQFFI